MNDITAIIVAKDFPPHIFETVESTKDIADETVILDIGLHQEIIEKLKDTRNIRIITIKNDIPYVELIREESKSYAKTQYVLFLDPDEVIPPTLAKKILQEYKKYDYISMPRKNIIFGKWMEHARWWPDHQIRLFKKDSVIWHQKLHAKPTVHGNRLTLDAQENLAITHHNYENITEYLKKTFNQTFNTNEIIEISYDFQSGSYIQNLKQNPAFFDKYTDNIAKVINNLGISITTIMEAGV